MLYNIRKNKQLEGENALKKLASLIFF